MLKPGDHLWIMGGGKIAFNTLQRLELSQYKITLCDKNSNCFVNKELKQEGYRFIQSEAHDMVSLFLDEEPNWVLPMIPLHLAGLWLKQNQTIENAPHHLKLIEDHLNNNHFYTFLYNNKVLYASRMAFDKKCKKGCLGDGFVCPITGDHWEISLFSVIEKILKSLPLLIKVFFSHQLGPSMGGIKGQDIKEALEQYHQCDKSKFIVATSSTCHAVIN
jgi:hypothetical protein